MTWGNKYKSSLGQHMTPAVIADLLVQHLPRGVSRAVDLAVGDGGLLTALQQRWPSARVCGIDCDPDRVRKAMERVGRAAIRLADGLDARIPSYVANGPGRFAVVGNPPFLATPVREIHQCLQSAAFPGVTSKHGLRRLEMSFLARGLIEAKRQDGLLAMITSGAAPSRGVAKAMGLVPKTASDPPQGAMALGELATISAIRPRSARRSTCAPSWPQ